MRVHFNSGTTLIEEDGGGVSIGVDGFQGNPTLKDKVQEQVYIEVYQGKLRVHVWSGEEDPTTIVIEPNN